MQQTKEKHKNIRNYYTHMQLPFNSGLQSPHRTWKEEPSSFQAIDL